MIKEDLEEATEGGDKKIGLKKEDALNQAK